MRSVSLIILMAGTFLAGCLNSGVKTAKPIAVAEIAAAYRSYPIVTDHEVLVNPELARLCIGISRERVEVLRMKHGPHANTAILIYMNEPAARAFSTGSAAYPEGAVIVKRKRIHDYVDRKSGKSMRSAENGVGGMVKRAAGFDPTHGDWEYFYFEDVTKIEAGRIDSCIRCHEGAKDKDYVFGTWRATPGARLAGD